MGFRLFLGLSPNPFSDLTAGRSRGVMRQIGTTLGQIGTTLGQIGTTLGAGGPHAIFFRLCRRMSGRAKPCRSVLSLIWGSAPMFY